MKSLKQANLVVYTRKKTQYETTAGRGRAKAAGEKEKAPPPFDSTLKKTSQITTPKQKSVSNNPRLGAAFAAG